VQRRLRDLQPSNHSTGVLARKLTGGIRQTNQNQRLVDARFSLGARYIVQLCKNQQILVTGQRGID
jgi:hypothetical protein